MSAWTKEPPTEPGWYWFMCRGWSRAEVVYYRGDMFLRAGNDFNQSLRRKIGKWWPEPIDPPQ